MSDQNEFITQVKLQFENLDELQAELEGAVSGAMEGGAELSKRTVKNFEGLKTRWEELTNLMKKASSETDFKEAQDAMSVIAGHANRVAGAVQKTNNVGILDAGKVKSAARGMTELARATEKNAKATIKTTLASQNVVRIIQDAPFGMMGIANNIEQMAESLGRLRIQTGSLGGALKATFMPLVSGPMALPFIISLMTAFTLSYDKLAGALDTVKVKLGLITEAQAEYNKEVAKIEKDGIKTLANSVPDDEIKMALDNARDALDRTTSDISKSGKAFADEFGFSFQEATKRVNEFNEAKIAAQGGSQGAAQLKPSGSTLDAFAALGSGKGKAIEDAKKQAEDIGEFIGILENNDKLLLKRQKLSAALGQGLGFGDDSSSTKDKKGKKVKSIEDAAIQLRIDAMEEGIAKVIAQIKLNAKKERKTLIEEFGQREDLLKLLEEKESNSIQQALDKRRNEINKANEKDIEEKRKQAIADRKERERLMLQAIKDETSVTMFGIEERALKIRNKIGESDPFALDIANVKAAGEAQLAEVHARRKELGMLLDAELADKSLANAELKTLSQEEIRIRQDTAEQVKKIEEAKKMAILSIHRETLGAASDMFGSFNTLAAREGEKGLEETKKFLFAQAVAEAIGSGISAYQSIMGMKGIPFPVKAVYAGVQMTAITARLMAAARSIKQVGKNGGATSAGAISGGFTQLNSSVTGQRVTNFQRQQSSDVTRSGNADVVAAVNDVANQINGINGRPMNVNVMLSDRGSAGIVTAGSEFNQRHTGRTTGSQVGK